MEEFLLIYSVVLIIVCCIFGAITRHININKGYDGGFAWGFFLGVIGIIVVACRAEKPRYNDMYSHNSMPQSAASAYARELEEKEIMRNGGWRCTFCNRVNYSYNSTCACGKTQFESKKALEEQK